MARIEKPILGGHEHRWQRVDAQRLLSSVRHYTRFVSLTKLTLGGASLAMIATIVIMPMLHGDKEGIRLAFSSVQEQAETVPMMKSPTFQGVDEKNQPYFVTADTALQHDQDNVVLNKVQADMMTEDQAWLSVKAEKGYINNTAKMMKLSKDVRLMHLDGYEFRTEAIDIDMQARIARGYQAINGFGPTGEIRANGFYWDHDAQILRFTGDVKMRLVGKP